MRLHTRIALGLVLLRVTVARAADEDLCGKHRTRDECLIFRRQHECVWDEPVQRCVADLPCESRSINRCTYELTTGSSWDTSTSMCFVDGNRCRWSDECFDATGALACIAAGCAWRKLCKPHGHRLPLADDLGVMCTHKCSPPHFPYGEIVNVSAAAIELAREVPPSAPQPMRTIPTRIASDSDASDIGVGDTYSYGSTCSYGCCSQPPAPPSSPIEVQLPSGSRLRGRLLRGVRTFLGVPFAAAPVGDLRFAAPKPAPAWAGVFDALWFSARCQPLIAEPSCLGYSRSENGCRGVSEDCLTLNIFAPSSGPASEVPTEAVRGDVSVEGPQASSVAALKAVMVWIHGGCYGYGSSSDPQYDGAPLASTQDVLVVSINYRLGALGFLGHDGLRSRDRRTSSTGNYGLLDAIEALRWVHANIGAFGGDPGRVTIFGESSGAGAVSQLLGARPAWPYFHQAIMESGAGAPWTYMDMRDAYHGFTSTLAAASCNTSEHRSIESQIKCLLAAPSGVVASSLGNKNAQFQFYCRDGCTWAPVIDGALLKGRPLDLARSRKIRPNTPIIAGHNLNDGALFVPTGPFGGYLKTNAQRLEYFARRFGPNHVAALVDAYPTPRHSQPGTDVTTAFMSAQNCETDFSYACATYWLAAANHAPSYIYQFSQVSPKSALCLHGYELQYVFGTGHFPSSVQRRVANLTMSYWGSFAREGKPGGGGLPDWPSWHDIGSDGRTGTTPDPWPQPAAAGNMLNISEQPKVVRVLPTAKGCSFFAEEWAYYQICLPENPSFDTLRNESQGQLSLDLGFNPVVAMSEPFESVSRPPHLASPRVGFTNAEATTTLSVGVISGISLASGIAIGVLTTLAAIQCSDWPRSWKATTHSTTQETRYCASKPLLNHE